MIEALTGVAHEASFTQEEINAVREGFAEFRSGKTMSQEDADKIFMEWVKEKGK